MLTNEQIKKLEELGFKKCNDFWKKSYRDNQPYFSPKCVVDPEGKLHPIWCVDFPEYQSDIIELAKVGIK